MIPISFESTIGFFVDDDWKSAVSLDSNNKFMNKEYTID